MRFRPRSIEKAIRYGATAGLFMIMGLAIVSGVSLYRFQNAITDLDYAVNKMPRKSELSHAFSQLLGPLRMPTPTQESRTLQREAITAELARVKDALTDYRRKAQDVPDTKQKLSVGGAHEQLLGRLERSVTLMQKEAERLGGPDHEAVRDLMLAMVVGEPDRTKLLPEERHRVSNVFLRIDSLPQLSHTVRVPLKRSRHQYQNLLRTVIGISAFTLVMYLLIVVFGFRGISGPIRNVVRGARRVAQREFGYRIDVVWPEEMAEVAAAFNMMSCRFQEAEAELENQVEERSRQLVRSERLADVGFIAAGVSHEINNPLHFIMTAAESLQGRVPEITDRNAPEAEVTAVLEYLKLIQRQSERCSQITTKLKDFARKSDGERMPTNLVNIVDEVLQLVGHLSKYRNRRITFARKEAAIADVNASQIQQVVLNLVANALESMDAGGELEIRIIDQVDFVVMEFQDNGCGMTEEVSRNLFEPFFTKRRSGDGTGLGLSITDRIVKDHNGTVKALSEGAGKGSLFRVRLPRHSAQTKAA